MTEQEALIALNMIPEIGSRRLKNLLQAFGSAPKIFLNSEASLKRADNIGDKTAKAIVSFSFEKLKNELESAKRLKVKIITIEDPGYPQNLKDIYDPPLCLYVKGELLPGDKLSLGIVGSRRASFYGLSCAEKFAYGLSNLGITVISGLARGIDTRAHKGALRAKARTIAVLGSGLNCIYPGENKPLAEEIAASGAVVSEFPLNTSPLPGNFPRRNRVISGLSLGIIVVEAARNSGALITADFALEQGREVFAVPGKVDSLTSAGTNQLIKQGAKLTDSIEDILEELRPKLREFNGVGRGEYPEGINKAKARKKECPGLGKGVANDKQRLSGEENLVYSLIRDKGSYVDDIIEEANLSAAKIMEVLLKLELQDMVRQLPGKVFIRKGAELCQNH